MKKLNLFIAALLTVLLMQYTVTQSQTYLIDKDTLAGFNRHECDTILTYLYQWSMLSEQVNSLSHQLAFDSTTISRQAIEVDIQKKINKSLVTENNLLTEAYKKTNINYSKISTSYDSLKKNQKWYWIGIGLITLVAILK